MLSFESIILLLLGATFFVAVIVFALHLRLSLLAKNKEAAASLDLVLKEREAMNETFRAIRAQRHDYLTHVGSLHYLIEEEKWDDARSYINELAAEYQSLNQSIKGEQGHVAAILHDTFVKAGQRGISVTYDLEVPFSSIALKQIDQSKLLGNLLSNALEAASSYALDNDDAKISLSSTKKSGLYIVEVTNSTLPISSSQLEKLLHVI